MDLLFPILNENFFLQFETNREKTLSLHDMSYAQEE